MNNIDYDPLMNDLFGREAYAQSIDALIDFAQIPQDARVLELCCGTGISSKSILRKTKNLAVVELDPKRMKIARQYLPRQVRLLSVDAHKLDPDTHGKYDYILCINGFHYFKPEKFYAIADRMLHSEGKLTFNVKLHDYNSVRPLHTRLGPVIAQAATETGLYHGPLDIRDGSFLDSSLTADSFSVAAPFMLSRTQDYALYHTTDHVSVILLEYWCKRYFALIGYSDPSPINAFLYPGGYERWANDLFARRFHSFINSLQPHELLAKAELFVEARKQ